MSARTGALVRSIEAMATTNVRAHYEARARYARVGMGELSQQFHLPISGLATSTVAVQEVEIEFEAPFVDAYDERQSPYIEPTFTTGIYMPTAPNVFFSVCVRKWIEEDGVFTGAIVSVAAFVVTGAVNYDGEIHLVFEGYGAPATEQSDEGDSP